MNKRIKVESCKFISATSLIPRTWDKWFWESIADNAPFSWGMNNRSLVTAESFLEHFETCKTYNTKDKEIIEFIKTLKELDQMYIDLET